MSISGALDRAHSRPPLSWMADVFRWIQDATMTSPARRTATAAVVAAGYVLAGAASGLTGAYAFAILAPALLLGVAPYARWRALQEARQMEELSQAAASAGLHDSAARLAAAADRARDCAVDG